MNDSHMSPAAEAPAFLSPELLGEGGATPGPRLRWLVRLRWVALASVAAGLAVAWRARFPWVHLPAVAAAVAVGLLYNLGFYLRLHPDRPALSRAALRWELQLHAGADVAALTWLLLACGGLRNPICMFYGFHVVLGAMLGYVPGAVLAAGLALCGVGVVGGAERLGLLFSAPLREPPLWLDAAAVGLTVLSLMYFSLGALRFLQREQGRALRNSQLLLHGLDTLQVGLELVGPGDRILLRNQRAADIHPCPDGTWRPPGGLPPGSGRDAAPRRFACENGETRIYEMIPLSGWQGEGLRAYLYVDRTEATVDEQRAIMLERLASLGRAMQAVAHELNTPLASIQTLAVDLSHSVQGDDATESVSLIVDEARRCREITRELLATARHGEEGTPVARRTVLQDVVRRAVRLTYGSAKALGRVAVGGDLHATCVTDSDRLLQILVNLLQNARDASDGPVEVRIDAPGAAEEVALEVRDHGPGLPVEVRQRLFRPFVTTKPPGQGTGLGLYTCARLARQLGAELTLTDGAPGSGVVARLVLPRWPHRDRPGSPQGEIAE